jgi:hypothetical protein
MAWIKTVDGMLHDEHWYQEQLDAGVPMPALAPGYESRAISLQRNSEMIHGRACGCSCHDGCVNTATNGWTELPVTVPPTAEETRHAELAAAGDLRDRLAAVDKADQQRRDEAEQTRRDIQSLSGRLPIPIRP